MGEKGLSRAGCEGAGGWGRRDRSQRDARVGRRGGNGAWRQQGQGLGALHVQGCRPPQAGVCAQLSGAQQGCEPWPEVAWGPSCQALPMSSPGLGFAPHRAAEKAGGTTGDCLQAPAPVGQQRLLEPRVPGTSPKPLGTCPGWGTSVPSPRPSPEGLHPHPSLRNHLGGCRLCP